MPHVDINVNTDVVKSAEIAKTMTDVVTVVAGHFETNAEYVAAGVASQGDHVLHRKDIEIVVSAASGANKVREAAGPALAKALLDPAFPKYRRYSVRREGDSAIRIMKL